MVGIITPNFTGVSQFLLMPRPKPLLKFFERRETERIINRGKSPVKRLRNKKSMMSKSGPWQYKATLHLAPLKQPQRSRFHPLFSPL